MIIKQQRPFTEGYNSITEQRGKHAEMLMDFGILRLPMGRREENRDNKERAYLLLQGEVRFLWQNKMVSAKRSNCFDQEPWCLHVPAGIQIAVEAASENAELAVIMTDNQKYFEPRLFTPAECRSEQRGKGTMKETSTRTVRTIFDTTNAPEANLVLGEVIDHPGKWSSYPPHHHPQPEIYFYKFLPENGFGYAEIGEEVYKVRNNDTAKITDGMTHPQTTAPGYAMYYLWAIRHLKDDPYIQPTFVPEHLWVTREDAKIWPDK